MLIYIFIEMYTVVNRQFYNIIRIKASYGLIFVAAVIYKFIYVYIVHICLR